MPPAARPTCDFPGCQLGPEPEDPETPKGPYITHIECKTHAEVTDDYKTHIEVAHRLPIKSQELALKQSEMDLNRQLATERQETDSIASFSSQRFVQKRDSLPRPKVGLGTSEADWGFFTAQWSRYVAGSHVTDEQQIHQLWAACSDELQRAMHDGGQVRISDPAH